MADKKDLSTLPQFLKPEVAERVAEHFKNGVFEFDFVSRPTMSASLQSMTMWTALKEKMISPFSKMCSMIITQRTPARK